MEDMEPARRASHTVAVASNASNAQSQMSRSSESSQNQKTLVAVENDFIHHSTGCAYSYDPVQTQAQAAQVYANNVQAGCAPFVGYGNDHIQGRGPHIPRAWHNHQQSAAFAGHYGAPQGKSGAPQLQPQPWPQPQHQPRPRLPAIEQLGFDHSYSSGGVKSVDSIVVKFCPGPSSSTSPGPIGGPSLEPWLLQRQRSHSAPPTLELNQQLQPQPGRSPSSSPSPPYLAPHGEYVPLLVNVRKLRSHETIKALIDKEDLLVMMNGEYPYPHSAFTPSNQTSPPPGTIADASACQGEGEDGTGTGRYPEAAAGARPKKDLFVFHVPNDMTEGELYKLFSQYGKLRRARIHHGIVDGKSVSKGYGFVTFKRFSDAVVAVHSLNGYKVGEKNKKALVVTYCRDRDTPRPIPANTSISANNGTKMNSADKRRARRNQHRLSTQK